MTEMTPEQRARIEAELADWYGDRQEMTQDDVQSLLDAHDALKAQVQALTAQVERLDAIANDERAANFRMRQDVEAANAQVQALTADLAAERTKREDAEVRLKTVREYERQANAALAARTAEVDRLRERTHDLGAVVESQKHEIAGLRAALEEDQRRLRARTSRVFHPDDGSPYARTSYDYLFPRMRARAEQAEAARDAAAAELQKWTAHHCQPRCHTRCPSCGHDTLFIAMGGHLTCSWHTCPQPALARAIAAIEQERDAALAREQAAVAIVRDLEFGVYYHGSGDLVCPTCHQLPMSDRDPHSPDRGHKPGCAVQAALAATAPRRDVDPSDCNHDVACAICGTRWPPRQ